MEEKKHWSTGFSGGIEAVLIAIAIVIIYRGCNDKPLYPGDMPLPPAKEATTTIKL